MKTTWIIAGCLLIGSLFVVPGDVATAEDVQGKIIGSKKCNVCHKQKKRGNQAEVWLHSAHAKAYEVLASDEAKAIAKEKGLGDPQQEAECLACHTTQGFHSEAEVDPKGKYSLDEGVGCEVCHGPGSEYKKKKIMKDPELAKAKGMLMPGSDFCLKCHNERSPSYKEFDFETRWAEIVHPIAKTE